MLIVSADAGARGGKILPYKSCSMTLLRRRSISRKHVLLVDRGPGENGVGGWARSGISCASRCASSIRRERVPVAAGINETRILYTSGTTGKPKGVQRDVGGYAVAPATSMESPFLAQVRRAAYSLRASIAGWVKSANSMSRLRAVAGRHGDYCLRRTAGRTRTAVWWKIVEKYQSTRCFRPVTAIRVLKNSPTAQIRTTISSLEALYSAGEPLDEPDGPVATETLGAGYRQLLADGVRLADHGAGPRALDDRPSRLGSPGVPMHGYNVQLPNEVTGEPAA
ncbi:AMP-binding protein [Salmonella enterica subsp. enterica]|nr:AMP-binding protein [Salmonella enterica subsp. enterica]